MSDFGIPAGVAIISKSLAVLVLFGHLLRHLMVFRAEGLLVLMYCRIFWPRGFRGKISLWLQIASEITDRTRRSRAICVTRLWLCLSPVPHRDENPLRQNSSISGKGTRRRGIELMSQHHERIATLSPAAFRSTMQGPVSERLTSVLLDRISTTSTSSR